MLLTDGNSVAHAAHNGTKLSTGDMETQAIFGTLNTIRDLLGKFTGFSPIVLWDAGTPKERVELFPEYKGNRDLNDPSRVSLRTQKPYILRALFHLGIPQMAAEGAEADDLAGMLAQKAEMKGIQTILVTGDRDWLQLVGEHVSWYEHRTEKVVNHALFKSETGYATPRGFLEGKALRGDSSDNVPGVGGIGEKGAVEFIARYGSVKGFVDEVRRGTAGKLGAALKRLAENKAPNPSKKFGKLEPAMQAFVRNMKLMDLSHSASELAKRVNVTRGEFDREKFAALCEELAFQSILRDLDGWLKPFEEIRA